MSLPVYCSSFTWYLLRGLERVGLLRLLSFALPIRQLGRELKLPIRNGVGLDYIGNPEIWADRLFPPLLQVFPGTFADVGVNLGQTLTRMRLIDPQRPYIGFEPNPACVAYSKELIALNHFADCPIVPAGLSDHDGTVELHFSHDSLTDSGATMIPGFKGDLPIHQRLLVVRRFASVELELDIAPIGVLKIDVEGAELEVLNSMEHRLAIDRPAVVLEILPVGQATHVDRLRRQVAIEALLQKHRYRLIRIRNRPGAISLELMDGPIGVHDDQELANFIVLPEERFPVVYPLLQAELAQQ
jgi:FkbM family methyltransferase